MGETREEKVDRTEFSDLILFGGLATDRVTMSITQKLFYMGLQYLVLSVTDGYPTVCFKRVNFHVLVFRL